MVNLLKKHKEKYIVIYQCVDVLLISLQYIFTKGYHITCTKFSINVQQYTLLCSRGVGNAFKKST